MIFTLALVIGLLDNPPAAANTKPATQPFVSAKYGVKIELPASWELAVREEDDRVFVAVIPQKDPARPGVLACELGLAPETLDEYRTRLDANAKRKGPNGGTLVKNEVVKTAAGEQLETLREFRPAFGGLWRELAVRRVANRQLYTFTLNVDEETYKTTRPIVDDLLSRLSFTQPNTGTDKSGPTRWTQREFRFALDLPEGWSPVLAPSEVALFYANAPAKGIWSDNVLVIAHPHRKLDLHQLATTLPDALRQAEPDCEVLDCKIVKQGGADALETIVRTKRGPFSMTILERRFKGERFDYEVKYTVESKRFDELFPKIRKSLDSFSELPGEVPRGGKTKSA